MGDGQFGTGAHRRAAEVPFFAPAAGEFTAASCAPAPRFGAPQPVESAPPSNWPPARTTSVPLEPVAGLGAAAVVLAAVVLAAVVTGATLLTGLVTVAADGSLAATVVSGLGSVATAGLLLASWIVVALWLGRARRWAWFGWIVPVALLFVPFQLVHDVWAACRDRVRNVPAPRLRTWWGLWLSGVAASNAASRLSDDASSATIAGLLLVSAFLLAGAAVAFAGVVRGVGAAQAVSPR
ncbi:DUF4328 domain-containing protein [Kineococcus sp. DHX-1]|uniref:DUF4328 domain-containing protein n=1 Tax=Kineococcus sp. DHX-1 TaxID=3349638 RepID=UPI0036D263B0